MAIEVPQYEEISGGRKGVGCHPSGRSEHIKKRHGGGVVKRDVDPYIIRVGIKRREEVESAEKNKPCLTKRMTPPLARVAS